MKLKKYEKEKGPRLVGTSLKIEESHLKFLKERNLNLSLLVRDLITKLINKESNNGK